MKSAFIATMIALGLSYPAMAQTTTPMTPPGASTTDSAAASRFQSADTNKNGFLDGAELEAHRSILSQVDKDNDGRISRAEYLEGVKAGHVK